MTPAVVSKSAFARLVNVSPTRVGQWLRERKLGGDALEGEGRFARIKVDVACQQLKLRLNTGQQLGNGLATMLDVPPPPAASVASAAAPPEPSDTVGEAIRLEKLREMQLRTRALSEAELARRGVYTKTEAARAALAKMATDMVSIFEGGLADLAAAVAAQYQLPARDVLHLLRAEFRTVRDTAARAVASKAAGEPVLVADEVETGADHQPVN
jgi:hypothetical protein